MSDAAEVEKRVPRFVSEGRLVRSQTGDWTVIADSGRDAEDIAASLNGSDLETIREMRRAEKAEAELEATRAQFETLALATIDNSAQRDALAAALRSVQTDMRSDCIEDDDVMRMEKTITDALVGIPESPAGKQKDGPDPIEVEARRLYTNMMDNHPTIHSNRFGTWAELTESGRNVWRIRARESQAGPQQDKTT